MVATPHNAKALEKSSIEYFNYKIHYASVLSYHLFRNIYHQSNLYNKKKIGFTIINIIFEKFLS